MTLFGPPNVSDDAKRLWLAAVEECSPRYSAYPRWYSLHKLIGFDDDRALDAFDELCAAGIVAAGMCSTIDALEVIWPLGKQGRPVRSEWAPIRERIFARDDYTCTYCGERGKKLECDHIVPVSRGGSYEADNLTTACFACNRSKRDKLVSEWKAA